MIVLDESVGIGVKSPACPLEVVSSSAGTATYKEVVRVNTDSINDRPYMSVGLPNTNGGALFAFEKDLTIARFGLHGPSSYNFKFGTSGTEISGNVGFGLSYNAALFIKPITASSSVLKLKGADGQTGHYFQVHDNSDSPIFNILSDGTIGVGTDTPNATLHVIGGAIVDYCTQVSDSRLKENFRPIENSLEKLNGMKGLYFNKIGNSKRQVGLIAQDVQAVLPEAVTNVNKDCLGIDYSQIVALLVNAVNEQQKVISELANRLDDLDYG